MKKYILFLISLLLYQNNLAQSSSDDIFHERISASQLIKMKRSDYLKKVVKTVQYISKWRRTEINEKRVEPVYEEYVSIGIIAAQALLKEKSEEELNRLPLWEMAARIDNSLIIELCRRYDFIRDKYSDYYEYMTQDKKEEPNYKGKFLNLNGFIFLKKLYENAAADKTENELASILEPYYKELTRCSNKIDSIYYENEEIPFSKFLSNPISISQWLGKQKVRIIEYATYAHGLSLVISKNIWGINNCAIKATISKNGFLSEKGYQGEYYLIEYGEWNINCSKPLLPLIPYINKRPRYCILYKEGKVFQEFIESESAGFIVETCQCDSLTIDTIRKKYIDFYNYSNGDLMNIYDEKESLRLRNCFDFIR